MSLILQKFFRHEITSLPQFLISLFGSYYNNAICNGCSLCFLLWYFLHLGFDCFVKKRLKKFGYKTYKCERLKNSLWNCILYGFCMITSYIILSESNLHLFKILHVNNLKNAQGVTYLNTELVIFVSYCLHTAFWEIGEQHGLKSFFNHILLAVLIILSFALRIVDLALIVVTLLSISKFTTEITKVIYDLGDYGSNTRVTILSSFFVLTEFCFTVNFLIGVPLLCLIPMGKHVIVLWKSSIPALKIFYFSLLILWYICALNNSPLFKLIIHWLNHTEKGFKCKKHIIECCLFPKRNDDEYNLMLIQKEIQQRTEKKKSLKINSKKASLLQIIYCNMKLNQKIKARRLAKGQTAAESADKNNLCQCSMEDKSDPVENVGHFICEEMTDRDETALNMLNIRDEMNDKNSELEENIPLLQVKKN